MTPDEFRDCFIRMSRQQKEVMAQFLKFQSDMGERGEQDEKIAQAIRSKNKSKSPKAATVNKQISNIIQNFGLSEKKKKDKPFLLINLFMQHRSIWKDHELFICKKIITCSLKNSRYIEDRYRNNFLYWDKQHSYAIRLVGASEEFFPPSVVHIIPHQEAEAKYALPQELPLPKDEIIEQCKQKAKAENRLFFDGPNTRLMDYRITPIDSTEQKHFYLHFGPVGWYEYSVCDWVLEDWRGDQKREETIDEVKDYIDLDEVAYAKVIKNSRLSNLCCTATTVVTEDGYILYSRRSKSVSAQSDLLTSAIAENMNRDKDHSLQLVPYEESPVPFRVVLRGIEEEASPKIAEVLRKNRNSVFLLGMDFELLSFHPDLLFLVFVPMNYEDFRQLCKQSPGIDFIEGSIEGIPLSAKNEINRLLELPNWVPGGKSSFIRSLEFLDTLEQKHPGLPLQDVVNAIKRSNK